MTGSFDGNDGNDGNAANSGAGGNATSGSVGWYFADRVDLPFVTVSDTEPNPPVNPPPPIAQLLINIPEFSVNNWSAEWYPWLVLTEFVGAAGWDGINILPPWAAAGGGGAAWNSAGAWPIVQDELADLVTAAQDERADALGEILSQADEFISYFVSIMTAATYPATTKLLSVASLVGTFVAMYYKGKYQRPRPSQLCPALLPPLTVPGHASFPSGHSTQSHLMALCMQDLLQGLPQQPSMFGDLWTLADRISRNREIAGFHYPSDTQGGVLLAQGTAPLLIPGAWYQTIRKVALQEWQ